MDDKEFYQWYAEWLDKELYPPTVKGAAKAAWFAAIASIQKPPTTSKDPEIQMGNCDLVSKPHPRNHCGAAWRPLNGSTR